MADPESNQKTQKILKKFVGVVERRAEMHPRMVIAEVTSFAIAVGSVTKQKQTITRCLRRRRAHAQIRKHQVALSVISHQTFKYFETAFAI